MAVNNVNAFLDSANLVRSWTPTITPLAPMTFGVAPSNVTGEWFMVANELFGALTFNSTTATAGSPAIDFTLPVTTIQGPANQVIGHGIFSDLIGQPITVAVYRQATSGRIVKYDGTNFALLANLVSVKFRYRIDDK